MQNKKFLSSKLRRFYCYIGVPNSVNLVAEHIAEKFNKKLVGLLKKQYPLFSQQIVLQIINQRFIKLKEENYQCDQNDKLIDIQTRHISTSILDDYANYLICSLSAIYYGQDEAKEFCVSSRFRNRTYQLYVMLEHLFKPHIDRMHSADIALFNNLRKKINNNISIFFDDSILFVGADTEDITILNELIMPRIKKIIHNLQAHDDLIEIKIQSYHVNDTLSFRLSKKIYESVKQFINFSYNNYY